MRNFGNNLKNWYGSVVLNVPSTSAIPLIGVGVINSTYQTPDFVAYRPGSTANSIQKGPNITLSDTFNVTNSVIQQSGGQLEFWNGGAGPSQAAYFASNNGFVVGAPTGGSKGAGTINATGLYVNGASVGGGFSPQVATLTGSTSSRTNTATPSVDSTLQVSVASAGTYKVELYTSPITGMASGQGGIAATIGLSASNQAYTASGQALLVGADNSNYGVQGFGIQSSPSVSSTAFFAASAAYSSLCLFMSGLVVLNAATTVGLWWCQASSNATATTLPQGTTLIVTRVA